MTLGSGLSVTKEVRDIFIDLVEKVMELCAAYGWRATEINAFFVACKLHITFAKNPASTFLNDVIILKYATPFRK
jgi:hypothetical protein